MIRLKDILSEAYAWERQEGKPLPTLAEVQAAYDAKMREEAGNEDPDEKDHEYTDMSDVPEPYNPNDDLYEAKADKDYDGDGEIESGSEEYLGSRDKAIKAAANTTAYGNYVNKARAKKAHLTDKDVHVYGIDSSGKGHKLTTAAEFDKYTKFTIKSIDESIDEYGGQDSDGIHADGPKNANSDVREKEQMIESFNKRMLGNLHGHEYILREAFKRK